MDPYYVEFNEKLAAFEQAVRDHAFKEGLLKRIDAEAYNAQCRFSEYVEEAEEAAEQVKQSREELHQLLYKIVRWNP